MKKKAFIVLNSFFFLASAIWAENDGLNYLFEKYCQNNTEFQKSVYQLEQTKISLEKTKLENGFNFSVSTGDVKAKIGKEDTVLSFSPEVTLGAKSWNNTKLSVEIPYSVSVTNPQSKNGLNDASLLVSTDIISDNEKQSKVTLEKAQRSVEEAQRNVQNKTVEIHIKFLNELISLLDAKQKIIEAENDLLDEQNDFNTIKAKGYSESSAKYRTAKLEVESAQRDVEELRRNYEASLAVFATKCSMQSEDLNLDFDIPDCVLVDFAELQQENFTELENAKWNEYISEKERNIKTTTSLSAQAGYGLSTGTSGDGTVYTDNVIKAGATLNIDGFTVSALASIPVTGQADTTVTMSLAWNPFTVQQNILERKSNEISANIDRLSILDAEESYRTTLTEQDEKRRNLDWQLVQYEEELQLYEDLEKDTSSLYEKGLVAESEYRQAKINSENSRLKLQETKIQRILYNDNVVKMFLPENK